MRMATQMSHSQAAEMNNVYSRNNSNDYINNSGNGNGNGNGRFLLLQALHNCLDMNLRVRRSAEEFISCAEQQQGYGVELAMIAMNCNNNNNNNGSVDIGIRQIRPPIMMSLWFVVAF